MKGRRRRRDERPTETNSDRRCQLRKDMTQNTVRLDDCKEEESEVTREARAGRGRGDEEKEETSGQEADEEKMEKDVERGGEKREGDAPQGSRVTNEERV